MLWLKADNAFFISVDAHVNHHHHQQQQQQQQLNGVTDGAPLSKSTDENTDDAANVSRGQS